MPKLKVYISSTFIDLKEYRDLLRSLFENQLSKHFELCKIMERMWDDGSQTPFVDECIREVKASYIYVVILGNKVGSFPPGESRTYTEIELDTALNEGKKVFCFRFLHFDKDQIDNPVKHDELLSKFAGKATHTFSNHVELESALLKHIVPHIALLPEYSTIKLSLNNPNPPEGFLGREEELQTIREKLDHGGRLMLINSEGGIGKTTLAAKYWHEELNRYKHAAWLFCEGGITSALMELAPQLNVDLSGLDEAGQLDAIKRGLHAIQNDFLLVLDNANDEGEITRFKQEFEGYYWHVLFTSRCQGVLSKEQELPITHLPPLLAKELFVRYYSEPTPEFDELLDNVLLAIQYHTLLTEVFAKNLAEAAELGQLDLKGFLHQLENEGLHLKENSFEIEKNEWAEKRKVASTDAILDALYDFGKLSPEQNSLLVLLALLPLASYKLSFILDLFEDENERPAKQLRDTLKELVKKGWIGESERNYKMSPVSQKLVLEKRTNLGLDAQPLLDRLNFLLAADAYNLKNKSLEKAAPYVQLVPHLSRCLKSYPSIAIANLNNGAGVYYGNVGNVVSELQAWQTYHNIYNALLIKEPLKTAFKRGLAISHEKIGGLYQAMGEHVKACLNYEECSRLFREIVESHTGNEGYIGDLATSYSKLGRIFQILGDLVKARFYFQEQLKLFERISTYNSKNQSYKMGLAVSYQNMGEISIALKEDEKAMSYFEKYHAIAKEIADSNPSNLINKDSLAISHEKLGNIYQGIGERDKALDNYLKSYHLMKEISESDSGNFRYKNGLAISQSRIGNFYTSEKDFEKALKYFMECRKHFVELHTKTEGHIVVYTFNFLLNTLDITGIIKHLIQSQQYPPDRIPQISESVKAMRREGYEALKPLEASGSLQENQLWMVKELGDEGWYEF